MSEHRDRDSREDRRVVDTTKALIELYKSAFGTEWELVFRETVKVSLG